MSAVDFAAWATPDLILTLGPKRYAVKPPSVEASAQLLAVAVRAEINLGLVPGPMPDALQEILDTVGASEPALGPVYDQMVADGVDPETLDRFSYYATFYWAKGAEYAGRIAELLWGQGSNQEGESAAPKD